MACCKSVDGGLFLSFFPSLHIDPEALRKKTLPPQSHFHDPPPELPKSISFTSTTSLPDHRHRIYPSAFPALPCMNRICFTDATVHESTNHITNPTHLFYCRISIAACKFLLNVGGTYLCSWLAVTFCSYDEQAWSGLLRRIFQRVRLYKVRV